ncbi:MAG: hypothetical protein ACRBI6_15570 [Acidimicrobiales bacterium]
MHDFPEPPPRLSTDLDASAEPVAMDADAAKESVEALVGDVVHVFRNIRPGAQWPKIARQVLEHHDPPVDERVLDEWYRQLQRRARGLLDAVVSKDIARIEEAIVSLRLVQGAPDLLARHDRHDPEIILD